MTDPAYTPPGDGLDPPSEHRPEHPRIPPTMAGAARGLPPLLAHLHRTQMRAIRAEREQREARRTT